MKQKPWLKYLIYILILCVLIFLKEYAYGKVKYLYYRFWGGALSYYLLIIIPLFFNVLIGLLLGLEHYLGELRKTGVWKANLPKLILVGLPSLYFSLTYVIGLIDIPFIQTKLLLFARLGTEYVSAFQIILGFVLITSLQKTVTENKEKVETQEISL